ncbi:hypothetical protein FHS21_006086 [Phyllobacterium trifolii]|uniref:Uncharacterized protein n=1 Tax=Phyllobacterium trifolii TaxID=300193 RepID=A0A839ULQ2_9HYPH|nr:hypothetical protein [Phyllobacterium trifolii]MBB3149632.1 hypothetical protein [Phyllobacterium trifolii]
MRLLGAEDLQAARRAAAGRFYQIGMAGGLPEGWTFAFRKSLSGACHWLHECAHAHLHAVPMLLSLGHHEY